MSSVLRVALRVLRSPKRTNVAGGLLSLPIWSAPGLPVLGVGADSDGSRDTTGQSWPWQPCWWRLWKNILKNKSTPQAEEEGTKSERNSTVVREQGGKEVAPGGCSRHWSRHSPWRACKWCFCSWNTASCGKEIHRIRVKNKEEETVEANCYGNWLQAHSHQLKEKRKLKIKIVRGKKGGEDDWGTSWLGIWW